MWFVEGVPLRCGAREESLLCSFECLCDDDECECWFVCLCADVLHVSVTSAVWIAHCSGRSRPRSRLIGVVAGKCAHWQSMCNLKRVLCISGLRCRVPLLWLAESVWVWFVEGCAFALWGARGVSFVFL